MAQVTTGIRKVLSHPKVYNALQFILGSKDFSRWMVEKYIINTDSNNRILDIGCGTANILDFMTEYSVEYVGFDPSNEYIELAKKKHGNRGTFKCAYVSEDVVQEQDRFDTILALGVLHHLDDDDVEALIKVVKKALKPGGRFIALDGCYVEGQNKLAKYLIDKDRGQNVRTEAGYRELFLGDFDKVSTEIKHKRWIPYTYCILVVQN
ncbi:class I SAM-dependent methyltransferase [Vibrio coralliilyticus]|uniref:Methyltransferase type 12 domain-containing protein n=1 Tax=Vibrio coralliilyticus TaxID=190893 RepID=A0AAN0SD32_9VIBR|nr:class I SAM-dependent methyltransferase [Vibrio coralliilyticus]AIW20294.1 hypothetical protein IX92_15190 [Vibrio coralliilyticus]NOH38578.1 class I SAM-dependent methyltransferase [Vibrio coralliilyticus]